MIFRNPMPDLSTLTARLPISLTPRLTGVAAVAAAAQLVLAFAIAGPRLPLTLALAGLAAFALVAAIDPRIAFLGPLGYLLLAWTESGMVSTSDVVLAIPVIVVGVSFLVGGDTARRARALFLAHRYKLAVALFAVLVLVGVAKGFLSGQGAGVLAPARMAFAPVILLGLAVFRDRRDLLRGLRLVFYLFVLFTFFQAVYYLVVGGSATAAAEVSTGGTRVISNSSAMYLSIAFVLLALHLAHENRLVQRIGLATLMVMSVTAIALGLARTTWAAAAVAIAIMVLLMPEMRRGLVRFVALAAPVLVLAALLLPVFAADQIETIQERLDRPEGPAAKDFSADFRREAWGLMLGIWEESPYFGAGFGQSVSLQAVDGSTRVVTNDPHNGFIMIMVATGLVGLAAFLALNLGFLRMAVTSMRAGPIRRQLGAWVIAAWFIFMANVFTGVVLGNRPLLVFMWILLSVPVALAALPEREPRASSASRACPEPTAPPAPTRA